VKCLAFLLLVLVCAPTPTAGAFSYPQAITLHGVTVRLEVHPDLGWTAYAKGQGASLALAFYRAGVIHAPVRWLRRSLPHEWSHGYEHARTGRLDRRLVPSCLSSPLNGLSPLYACQATEVRARAFEAKYRKTCGDSLYPFGFPNERACTAPKP
jgi:hypothetical protein